jgi:two-component system sensor histidine kinase BaeS
MRQSTLRFELVGSAVAAGVLGATICFDAVPGLNWALWTALVATELAIFARPRLGANRAAFHVTIAFAVVLGLGAALTANPFSLGLIFVTVATLLGVAARLAAGLPAPLLGVAQLLGTPFAATLDAIREASARANATVRALLTDVSANVAVGLAIALPVVVIFGLLLSGADPTLSSWRRAIASLVFDWSWFWRFAFFALLATLSLGTFGLAAGGLTGWKSPEETSRRLVLGDTERRIVVGAVDALFALFLVLQAFNPQAKGQSYTAYVHNGFAELTIVATLSVILVAVLHNGRPRVGTPWGTLALLAECELLVASALYRIVIYQRDFGYTSLRIWVTAYMLLVAGLLALVAYEVARPHLIDARRFVRRGALMATATLTVMVYGNPDAWVAQFELHRFQTTGKLNLPALGDLSSDAVPTLLTLAKGLPASCVAPLRLDSGRDRHWYEWSARQARARRALTNWTAPDARGVCPVEPW